MSIKDYDNTIDYIEDNITENKGVLFDAAEKLLNVPGRDADEFFSCVEPEGRTIKKYIRDRKLYCALQDFISGKTSEHVAEKYGISDASRFSTDVRAMVGKPPQKLRNEGYKVPEVKHLNDILKMEIFPQGRSFILTKEKTKKYIAQVKRIQEENTHLKDELAIINQVAEKKSDNYIEEIKRLIDENYSLKDELMQIKRKEMSNRMATVETHKRHTIKKDEYLKFLKVEECRRQYGFTVEQILNLYRESLNTGQALESLCDEALYDFRFEIEEMEKEIRGMYEIEDFNYHLEYEMNNSEAFDYYFGDDSLDELSEDPYADSSDVETWEEYDDINPEDRLENTLMEMELENEKAEQEINKFEDYIEELWGNNDEVIGDDTYFE